MAYLGFRSASPITLSSLSHSNGWFPANQIAPFSIQQERHSVTRVLHLELLDASFSSLELEPLTMMTSAVR
jgi:hypothetical protein